MTVPTPFLHFPFDEPPVVTFVTDSQLGYIFNVTVVGGSGGTFGNDGRLAGDTAYCQTTTNYSYIYNTDATYSTLRNLKPAGSWAAWVKCTPSSGGYAIWTIEWVFNGVTNNYSHVLECPDAPERLVAKFAMGNVTWDTVTWQPSTFPDDWLLLTMTWAEGSGGYAFYVNGVKIGDGSFLQPLPIDNNSYEVWLTSDATACYQDVKLWTQRLTDAEVEELYENSVVPVDPCTATIPLDQREFMWDIAEARMPCTCTVQRDQIVEWTAIATDVPCMLEALPPRRQLDESSGEYVTDEQWRITISGRTSLPSPGAFSTVRFLVLGMVLESYNYYQSPDDITTTIDCRKV
jgi:hypothetical protein